MTRAIIVALAVLVAAMLVGLVVAHLRPGAVGR
jgi:hypothetical protein